jgi:hypothetical protein
MPRSLAVLFALTDGGFVLYWLITALALIPPEYLYNDYTQPILVAWNWSFLPLDLAVSLTGFLALAQARRGRAWEGLALLSLAFTSASGLNALAFWVIRREFDPTWWLPNLYLLLYPLAYIPGLLRRLAPAPTT